MDELNENFSVSSPLFQFFKTCNPPPYANVDQNKSLELAHPGNDVKESCHLAEVDNNSRELCSHQRCI